MHFRIGCSASVMLGPTAVGLSGGAGGKSTGTDFSAAWDASCLSCNSAFELEILNGIRVGVGECKLVGTDGPLEAGTLSGAGPPVPFGEISRDTLVGVVGLVSA